MPTPFEGKNLRIHVVESFLGKQYAELAISELRFFDGIDLFALDPKPSLLANIKTNKKAFEKVGIKYLLNDSYSGEVGMKKPPFYAAVQMRFRADGSFYISGYQGEITKYFSLGNYEIKSTDPVKGIKLRIFGLYYESEVYGDCNGCGRECNKANDDSVEKIFQEFIWIKPGRDGDIHVMNPSGGKRIKFDELVLKRDKSS